jgi:hypothetical protein
MESKRPGADGPAVRPYLRQNTWTARRSILTSGRIHGRAGRIPTNGYQPRPRCSSNFAHSVHAGHNAHHVIRTAGH